jgi:hypothetical protein
LPSIWGTTTGTLRGITDTGTGGMGIEVVGTEGMGIGVVGTEDVLGDAVS